MELNGFNQTENLDAQILSAPAGGASLRHQRIMELIDQRGWVTTDELSQEFKVSSVTIRTDLRTLAMTGRIERTRGGARLVSGGRGEPDFRARLQQRVKEKRQIGSTAAALLSEAQIISLDASTSCYYLAQSLTPRSEMFVLTNGMRTAEALVDRPRISVMLVGGVLRKGAMSMTGETAEEQVSQYQVEVAVFGARAFSLEHGLMDFAPEEARVKRAMAAVAGQTIGLVDHTKFGRLALLPPVVPMEKLNTIVTDQYPGDEFHAALNRHQVNLVVPEKAEHSRPTDSSEFL